MSEPTQKPQKNQDPPPPKEPPQKPRLLGETFYVIKQMTVNRVLIGLGAGITSAVLFLLTTRASLFAIVLSSLSPLPIMMATMGWTTPTGAIAVATATLGLGVIFSPAFASDYLMLALPSLTMAGFCIYRTKIDHAKVIAALRPANENVALVVFLPPGFLLLCLAMLGMMCAHVYIIIIQLTYGTYEAGVQDISRLLLSAFNEALTDKASLLEGVDVQNVLANIDYFLPLVVNALPIVIGIWSVFLLGVNTWLAARCTKISGLLQRAWPDLARTLRLPPTSCLWMTGFCAVCYFPFPLNLIAGSCAGALGMAYGFQGLAMVHSFAKDIGVKNKSLQYAILSTTWLFLVLLSLWPFIILALFGFLASWRQLLSGSILSLTRKRKDKGDGESSHTPKSPSPPSQE